MSFSNSLRNHSKVPVLFSEEPVRAKVIWLVEFWMKKSLFTTFKSTKQSGCFGKRLERNLLLGLDELTYRQAHWDFCCCATPTTW